MRVMFCVGVLTACGVALAAPVPKEKAKPKTDAEAIRGTWQLTDLDAGGIPLPADAKQMTLAFDGDTVIVTNRNDAPKGGTFTLDPTAKPKAVDFVVGKHTAFGIYELDGDTLKMCLREDGTGSRPTEFKAAATGETMVFTLKRRPDEVKAK